MPGPTREFELYAELLANASLEDGHFVPRAPSDQALWESNWYGRYERACPEALDDQCLQVWTKKGYFSPRRQTESMIPVYPMHALAIVIWLAEQGLEPSQVRPVADVMAHLENELLLPPPVPPPVSP